MNRSIRIAFVAAVLGAASTPALAGPQYVDRSGFAVSGHDVVAYRDLGQNPVGVRQPQAVPGKASITASYNGATWAFATQANRDRFIADPARYVPAFDGHCAYGVSVGNKVPANPHLWRIRDDRLYLNITRDVARRWEEDIAGNVATAERNWSRLESKAASRSAIPGFGRSVAPIR